MTTANRQWRVRRAPQGRVTQDDFEWHVAPIPAPADGQFLVHNRYLDLSPAMRLWLSDAGWRRTVVDYFPPLQAGEVMRGACVGEVVESRHSDYREGELVTGLFGWQDYAVSDGGGFTPVQRVPDGIPPTWPLGVLGITSLTAYFGLLEIGRPQAGETVAVSGAAGATGSVAGQIARLRGCRVVGIAGGPEKCAWLTGDLGFDAVVDYKAGAVEEDLRAACPDGIDVFFDNVGGAVLDAALANLARGARVVISGGVSGYDDVTPRGPGNYGQLVRQRARMEGFLIFDYLHRAEEALAELVPWVTEGRLRHREDIRQGLARAPEALAELFTGGNRGKLLVSV